MTDDVFDGYGIEISLKNPNDFLKVRETLTRIGIGSKKNMRLYQSCHILHKKGRYAIVHFKELFAIDGKGDGEIPDEDISRRNLVAVLLRDWGLVDLLDEFEPDEPVGKPGDVTVVKFRDKHLWEFIPKYTFSRSKEKR